MMHRVFAFLFVFAYGCLGVDAKTSVTVGMVLDSAGRDDKSFSASAYQGAMEAKSKIGVALEILDAANEASIETHLRALSQRGTRLVIAIGIHATKAIETLSKEFPKTHFLLVDGEIRHPNVRSVIFNEHEGAFVMGVLAGLMTKTRAVGFIGAMDSPLFRRLEIAYRNGAKYANPFVQVLTNHVGSTPDAWKNPSRGRELALQQIQKNVDIIFAAAGGSSLGIFDAVENKKKFAIGCDSNQNWIKPGRILTSMLKRADHAVLDAIQLEVKSHFSDGVYRLGLKEGGIDYASDEFNKAILPESVFKKLEKLKSKIIGGEVFVPDYYELTKKGRYSVEP